MTRHLFLDLRLSGGLFALPFPQRNVKKTEERETEIKFAQIRCRE